MTSCARNTEMGVDAREEKKKKKKMVRFLLIYLNYLMITAFELFTLPFVLRIDHFDF